jgi:lysophospholipase L1-like esterase
VSWSTFVAVGDSFTEGLEDGPDADDRYVGWADRVATGLTRVQSSLRYANLAVRGRLLDEVVADQLVAALAQRPDLLSFHAGGNDVLRPGADVDGIVRRYDLAVRRAVADADTVVLFTVLERSGGRGRAADQLAARIGRFNDGVRRSAVSHGAVLVDLGGTSALHDRRLWADDRLHLATDGHRRVAAAVLEALDVPVDHPDPAWWRVPLPPAATPSRLAAATADVRWVTGHLLPWLGRRLRGVSSGDGRTAKRPRLEQV